jgi:integrase
VTRIRLKYVQAWVDGGGRVHRYFRRRGYSRIRLPGLPGSAEFMAAYQAALGSRPEPLGVERSPPGSLSAALAAYYPSNAFEGLQSGTRGMRRAILERWRAEDGDKPIARLPQEYIERRLSKLPPHAARNWLKAIRHFLAFCKGERLIKYDVSAGIKAKVPQSDGFHTWSDDEIARYEAHYPVGSKARLALAIGLYTALRRGDAVRLGRQHIRDGVMSIRLDKTRVQVTLPVLPELQRTIEASPVGELTLLVTKTGKSYGANDFSAQFRKWCDDAGMPPECSFHGLRKAACTRLADARCTVHQIMAVSGHKSIKEAERYTREADRKRLAREAFDQMANTGVKPPPSAVSNPLKAQAKKARQ